MAEIQTSPDQASDKRHHPLTSSSPQTADSPPKRVPLVKLYALPVPIRTFPLPYFSPTNPLSLCHLAYAWLSQVLFPPPSEPATIHEGIWSPETRSVNVTNSKSIRALWENGFFGKGTYSRSEPNWLKREKIRRGLVQGDVSEQATRQRREERANAKWARGRDEQAAIEEARQREIRLASQAATEPRKNEAHELAIPFSDKSNVILNGHAKESFVSPPVGPLQLLALPNSTHDLFEARPTAGVVNGAVLQESELVAASLLPRGLDASAEASIPDAPLSDAACRADKAFIGGIDSGSESAEGKANGDIGLANGHSDPNPRNRRKSVRFSPKVEATTFQLSDPPSPHLSVSTIKKGAYPTSTSAENSPQTQPNGSAIPTSTTVLKTDSSLRSSTAAQPPTNPEVEIHDKECLNLSYEEAFFLKFVIGALDVVDPESGLPLSTEQVFALFRRYSYFPPRIAEEIGLGVSPDDPFLVNYAVYHHFRSLGWVPRHGIKFGVDLLLYHRGVVFSHADYGCLIVKNYSDPSWKTSGCLVPRKSWHWLHGINRVMTSVFKTLLLVYVDVPPPAAIKSEAGGVLAILKQFKIREVPVRRFSPNRNRD